MAKTGESTDLVKCSFCGKSQKQVTKLVAGPNVYICNECIDLCNDIIEQELTERPVSPRVKATALGTSSRHRVPRMSA